jgi:hypothetical protein
MLTTTSRKFGEVMTEAQGPKRGRKRAAEFEDDYDIGTWSLIRLKKKCAELGIRGMSNGSREECSDANFKRRHRQAYYRQHCRLHPTRLPKNHKGGKPSIAFPAYSTSCSVTICSSAHCAASNPPTDRTSMLDILVTLVATGLIYNACSPSRVTKQVYSSYNTLDIPISHSDLTQEGYALTTRTGCSLLAGWIQTRPVPNATPLASCTICTTPLGVPITRRSPTSENLGKIIQTSGIM